MISDAIYTFNDKKIPREYDDTVLPSFAIRLLEKVPKHKKLTLRNIVTLVNEGIDEKSYSYLNKATVGSSIPFLIQGGFCSVEVGVISVGVMGYLFSSEEKKT